MPYVKGVGWVRLTKSKEELSLLRSRIAKEGVEKRKEIGYKNVGRKKGWTKDPELKAVPTKTLTVRQSDYEVFTKCAYAENVAQVEFMHKIAEKLKEKNPQLFAPNETKVLF
jgi:hypothetical protein